MGRWNGASALRRSGAHLSDHHPYQAVRGGVTIVPALNRQFKRQSGKVRKIFRQVPHHDRHSHSARAASAHACLSRQGGVPQRRRCQRAGEFRSSCVGNNLACRICHTLPVRSETPPDPGCMFAGQGRTSPFGKFCINNAGTCARINLGNELRQPMIGLWANNDINPGRGG